MEDAPPEHLVLLALMLPYHGGSPVFNYVNDDNEWRLVANHAHWPAYDSAVAALNVIGLVNELVKDGLCRIVEYNQDTCDLVMTDEGREHARLLGLDVLHALLKDEYEEVDT